MYLDYDYRDCAHGIYDEAVTPHLWEGELVIGTIVRVHAKARYLVWLAESMEVSVFAHRAGKEIPSVGDYVRVYPRGFILKEPYPEYSSFVELTYDDEKYGPFWLIATTLDIYRLSKRLLHNQATKKTIFYSQITKLKNLCFSVIQAEKHEFSSALGKDSASPTVQDSFRVFRDMLPPTPEGYLSFKDALSVLEAKYTEASPFAGHFFRAYFNEGTCFIARKKKQSFSSLSLRSLSNSYSKVIKIHKSLFPEK